MKGVALIAFIDAVIAIVTHITTFLLMVLVALIVSKYVVIAWRILKKTIKK